MNQDSEPSATLLSTLQNAYKPEVLRPHTYHPFSTGVNDSYAQLQDLVHQATHLSHSLNQYLAVPFTNEKLISLFRQHATLSRTLHLSNQSITQLLDSLRGRTDVSYGEDIPLDAASVVSWCASRVESWGVAAGMETYKDEARANGITLALAGKVFVVDIDFAVDRSKLASPKMTVSSVKTSYAADSSHAGSPALHAFLAKAIRAYCAEVQKPDEVRNPSIAAELGHVVVEHLKYLVLLDRLATRPQDGGVKWFTDIDELCPSLVQFSKEECRAVALSLSLSRAPLDIFLHRSHSLPLPYFLSPSISFLIYVSPLTYLRLLRQSSGIPADPRVPEQFDIPLSQVTSYLKRSQEGVTLATLRLHASSYPHVFPSPMSMPSLSTRPAFPLNPRGFEEHAFPQASDSSTAMDTSDSSFSADHYSWILDFTNGGRNKGVVMSQSRMKDIELVVNPFGGMSNLNPVSMMAFGNGSWVDLLFNPTTASSPERYTALYVRLVILSTGERIVILHRSLPSGVHPPLQLRLTAPEEPGFILEKVPVYNMKEVLGVLEIVREQCWLNEILMSCSWSTDGAPQTDADTTVDETPATHEELESVLRGTAKPRKIPVNVFLPSPASSSTDTLFTGHNLDPMSVARSRCSKIVMTSPERPPMTGLVEISITSDESRPKGLSIEVNGAMGMDLKPESLEEFCRRGGTLGLPGRIWMKAHH